MKGIASHFRGTKAALDTRHDAKGKARLRTPPPGEIEKIMDAMPASPPPPAPEPDPTSPYLLGTPPRKRASPSKRKAGDKLESPTKSVRINVTPTRKTVPEQPAQQDEEEDDGLVLTPGRLMATRVPLGSPKNALPRNTARRIMGDEDDTYLTPRAVRERPKSLGSAPLIGPSTAAQFKAGHDGKPMTTTSSAINTPSTSRIINRLPDLSTPTSKSSLQPSSLRIEAPEPEPALPDLKHQLAADLPLPTHYSSLMTLHVALEHALLVHLATSGASAASLNSGESDMNESISRTVRLPNLITYTALRPLVERTGGRRLGPTELRRLASVWTDFHSDDSNEVHGLGFIVSKTRALDARTGRRVWDWGIGIELEIHRAERPKTPPMQVGFGGVTTPKGSSSCRFTTPPPDSPKLAEAQSPSKTKAREGMSLVAMWNNGLEVRKAEVSRRLRHRCGRFHQLWLDERGISIPPKAPATPSRVKEERHVVMGEGGLLTPSATRSGGRRIGGRTIVLDNAQLDASDSEDDENQAKPDGRSGLLAELDGERTKQRAAVGAKAGDLSAFSNALWQPPPEGDVLSAWHPEFEVNDPKSVRAVPPSVLPELHEAPVRAARPLTGLGIHEPGSGSSSAPPSTPTHQRISSLPSTPSSGSSLKDRIRAKEEAKRTALLRGATPTPSKAGVMAHFSRRATLSRLPELASIVFMLFPTHPRPPTLAMTDVLGRIAKSTKTTMSTVECRDALNTLNEIVPGFLDLITVAGQEWVKLGRRADGAYWPLRDVRDRVGEALHRDRDRE